MENKIESYAEIVSDLFWDYLLTLLTSYLLQNWDDDDRSIIVHAESNNGQNGIIINAQAGQELYITWNDIKIDTSSPNSISSTEGFKAQKNGVYLFSFTANCCDKNDVPDGAMAEVDIHVKKDGILYNIIHDHTQLQFGNNISFTWMDNLVKDEVIKFELKLGCLKSTSMKPVIFTAEYTGVTI